MSIWALTKTEADLHVFTSPKPFYLISQPKTILLYFINTIYIYTFSTILSNKNITKFLINARDHFIYCWRFGITFFRMTRMTSNHEFFKCTVPKRDRYRFSSNPMDQKQTVLATLDSTGTGSNFTRVGVRPWMPLLLSGDITMCYVHNS